ncbi:MAG TPA: HAD family hydrolase [Candidatus Limnocylindrales bacterium]
MTGRLAGVTTVSFDFGNTLVPVGRDALRRVVELTADGVVGDDPSIDRDAFLAAWVDERERQFRQNVPQFREVDIGERLVRVFARLRGMSPPGPDEAWDVERAAALSQPGEIERALDRYSRAFVDGLPPATGVDRLLEQLAGEGRTLAILSNWPLAVTIDRYAEARGWTRHLAAIVVSERVGVIKPHPAFFAAAWSAIGRPDPAGILHVGDDWAADVVGAADAGWRTAWIADRPSDSPLPSSSPDADRRADLTLDAVADLADRLAPLDATHAAPAPAVLPGTVGTAGEGRGP